VGLTYRCIDIWQLLLLETMTFCYLYCRHAHSISILIAAIVTCHEDWSCVAKLATSFRHMYIFPICEAVAYHIQTKILITMFEQLFAKL